MKTLLLVTVLLSSTLISQQSFARCAGFPQSCSAMSSRFFCQEQDGCSWMSTGERCVGVARSCLAFPSELSCQMQRGCVWQRGTADIEDFLEAL